MRAEISVDRVEKLKLKDKIKKQRCYVLESIVL